MDIALAIAQAMKYLHTRQPPILHRNLTAVNVLVRVLSLLLITDISLSSTQFID
jgi:serine/threonine protein kinase